mgnify:CR=1 FL=1
MVYLDLYDLNGDIALEGEELQYVHLLWTPSRHAYHLLVFTVFGDSNFV